MNTALVVGGGPNGLAAAISLAAEGVQVTVLEAAEEVGGGARSSTAIIPGLLHDHCSAIHPMAVGSQFLNKFDLQRYGLSWRWPDIDCVHPLDGGSAGVLYRSVEQTAAGLGGDGSRWRKSSGSAAAGKCGPQHLRTTPGPPQYGKAGRMRTPVARWAHRTGPASRDGVGVAAGAA